MKQALYVHGWPAQVHTYNFQAPHAGGPPPPLSIPSCISPHPATHRSFLSLWLLGQLLDCTLKAYKTCAFPASRPKKEPKRNRYKMCLNCVLLDHKWEEIIK